ncbi:MBL fold metallo-hydrolase [bacterium I07]|nr:MBL fold metallo-hydrolase [bacterium I07]
MYIRCWGARGSIPVSGRPYLKYGGDTTCMEIRLRSGTVLIIDAGTGIRRLGSLLVDEGVTEIYLLFTHSHWDHLLGFLFFKPLYRQNVNIHVYGCTFAQNSVQQLLKNAMDPPFFPVQLDNIQAHLSFHGSCREAFEIDRAKIHPVFLSHPNKGIGYKFVENNSTFAFLTDNELGFVHPGGLDFQSYVDFCKDVQLLIHDAEFTEAEYERTKTWGHSTYNDALKLALSADAGCFGLFHHNQDRTDAALDKIVDECQQTVKMKNRNLPCYALFPGWEMSL